jgi:hypothetical protein
MEHHSSHDEITARVRTIDPALLHQARRTQHDLDHLGTGPQTADRTLFDLTPPEHHDDDDDDDEALTPPRGYRPKPVALSAPPVVRQRQRQRLPSVSVVFPPPSSSNNIHVMPMAIEDAIDQPEPEREKTDPMRTIFLPARPPAPPPVSIPIPIMRPPPLSDSISTIQERVAHPPPSSNVGTFLLVVTAVIATAVAITLILGSAPAMKRRFSHVDQGLELKRELDVNAAILRPAFFVRAARIHLAT